MATLGFIGTGLMGSPMAQSLLRAGHELIVFDVDRRATEACAALGARVAGSAAEAAAGEFVFVMVKTGSQVEEVILGDRGILAGLRDGRTLTCAVMATIAPPLIRKLAATAGPRGLSLIDAPVSGGPILAQLGVLTFMVGGDESIVETVKPYLGAMGNTIITVGPLGSGLMMKLVNNMVGITNAYVFTEAMRIAAAGGLDLAKTVEVINASSGRNWCSENWDMYVKFVGAVLKDDSFHATVVKDIETAIGWVEGLGLESPILGGALDITKSSLDLPEDTYRKMEAVKAGG